MKVLKALLIAAGFYLLFVTIRSVGVAVIAEQLARLHWKLLPPLFIYLAIYGLNTAGWLYSFPKKISHVPFFDLCVIRIIGETLNTILPFTGSLGGEPVKAEILKRRHGVPLSEGYASALIVHTTFWVSLNLFIIGALLFTFQRYPLTPLLWNGVLAFLAALGGGGILLLVGLQWGIFERIYSIGEKWNWWGAASSEKSRRLLRLDEEIRRFYRADPSRFILSSFYNFLAWMGGVVEVYYMAHLLGMPITFAQAWLFESLIQVIRVGSFFIPASIGAQEGGIVFIFSQMGFAGSAAVTFAVLRRIREILWVGIGLLLWSFLKEKQTKEI